MWLFKKLIRIRRLSKMKTEEKVEEKETEEKKVGSIKGDPLVMIDSW